MFTIAKSTGSVVSQAGETKKGGKGRVEVSVSATENGTFNLTFQDFGNYGKVRWEVQAMNLTREELTRAHQALGALIQSKTLTTHVPFVEAEATEESRTTTRRMKTAEETTATAEPVST